MSHELLTHLDLLAEFDSLGTELTSWVDRAPPWPPARHCQALVRRLLARVDTLRVRLDAPLVVATLGGTGTGKSSLVNALVGGEVTEPGRERPTTRQPTLICRPGLPLTMLGIDTASVAVVERDAPVLRDLVIIDCPDPDTTEDEETRGTNLARLRELLPHCDVLLVTTTQQKYRSARVADELASAAIGARLVFVQTHADLEADIREDWQQALGNDYATGEMFFVDSVAALAEVRAGLQPHGEFARLVDLLTRELAVTAAHRIRRANFLDLVAEALMACRERIEAAQGPIGELETAIQAERTRLAAKLADRLREDLLASRRSWENRLVGEVASRWGFSPFACVLRVYQGLGGLATGIALLRVRSSAQLALWGALEGGRRLRAHRQNKQSAATAGRVAALGWDTADLRTSAIIVDGYATEAGFDQRHSEASRIQSAAAAVASGYLADVSGQLQAVIQRQARRQCGWAARLVYEMLFTTLVVALLYRFAKNFFFDSWIAPELGLTTSPQPVLGTDFFLGAALVLVAWSGLLLWSFIIRLRRGLSGEINEVAQDWTSAKLTYGFFADSQRQCREIHAWQDELARMSMRVAELQARLAGPQLLGRRRGIHGKTQAQ